MTTDLLVMVLVVGAATWALRFGPTKLRLQDLPPDSALARFLAATGPAAIATLCVASALPMLQAKAAEVVPLGLGTLAVLVLFYAARSVVLATLGGAAAYGLGVWLMGPPPL